MMRYPFRWVALTTGLLVGVLLLGSTSAAHAASPASTPPAALPGGINAHPTPAHPWLTATTRVDFSHPLPLPSGVPNHTWVTQGAGTLTEALRQIGPSQIQHPEAAWPNCDNGTAYPIWITDAATGQSANIWFAHQRHLYTSVAIYDCPLKAFWDTVFVVGSVQLDSYGVTATVATGTPDGTTIHYGAWLVVLSWGCDDAARCGTGDGQGEAWTALSTPRQTLWDVSAQVPVWQWLFYGARGSMTLHGAEHAWDCWGCRFDFAALTPWNDD